MLSEDFLKLVLIASIIAILLGWLTIIKWRQGFAYRIKRSSWMFGIAAMLAIFIALITIFYQTIRAAKANLVKGLRSE